MTAPTEEEVDGLAIRRVGDGLPLVLLHGFTGSSEAWPAREIARLAEQRRVVLVDLPGHGRSPVDASDPGAFALPRTLARLRALASSPVAAGGDWLGYSMGGRLALLAAVDGVPMRSLLLESASDGIEDPDLREERRQRDEALAEELHTVELGTFVDRWTEQPLFASQRALPEQVRAIERERRLRNDPAGLAAALRGFGAGRQPWLGPRLHELDLPVTLLTGALDQKFEAVAHVLESRLRHVRHRSVSGVGHTVHLEAPERWVTEVLAHLDHVESTS